MSATTGIEWTDATWNPTRGCTPVSAGCSMKPGLPLSSMQIQPGARRDER